MKRTVPAIAAFLCLTFVGRGEIVDSVVATVGERAIKKSDVLRDIQITSFLNRTRAEINAGQQLEAVNRLIDQAILRQDIVAGEYEAPAPAVVDQLFRQLRARYDTEKAFRDDLAAYGIDEAGLRAHLAWQIQVLEYLELRFGGGGAEGDTQAAQKAADDLADWLDGSRKTRRITIRTERLK